MTTSSNSTDSTVPEFNSFALIGDSVSWLVDGYILTARIAKDEQANISDSECYSDSDITAWKNDEWFFVGIVVSAAYGGVELDNFAASMWGVECNFGSGSKNTYLAQVAKELEAEAVAMAEISRNRILEALAY